MHLRPFKYFRPTTLSEFFEITDHYRSEDYVIMGAGTDILVKIKHRLIKPSVLISLRGIPELKAIERKRQNIIIGAAINLRQIKESNLIKELLPALSQAAGWVASPQIRNMGTIGGNICLDTRCLYYNQPEWICSFPPCFKRGGDKCHLVKKATRCHALFCADTPPALLSLNAKLVIADSLNKKEISLSQFYKDDGLSCQNLSKNELLVAIKLSVRKKVMSAYKRFSLRGAIEFPMVGVAVCAPNAADGNINGLRIAATGVQSQPIRLKSLERHLQNKDPADKEIMQRIETELKKIKLIRHQGIPPSYKREILKVLIEQNIHDCVHKEGGNRDEASA
ncbi:FAD binding domain-containing protein [Thermodesulfobacteriota bacterium]